jgi:hypothetical protein
MAQHGDEQKAVAAAGQHHDALTAGGRSLGEDRLHVVEEAILHRDDCGLIHRAAPAAAV